MGGGGGNISNYVLINKPQVITIGNRYTHPIATNIPIFLVGTIVKRTCVIGVTNVLNSQGCDITADVNRRYLC